MTGYIVLVVIVMAVIAALEISNRRNSTGPAVGPRGAWVADDRDMARTKLDLLALPAAGGPDYLDLAVPERPVAGRNPQPGG